MWSERSPICNQDIRDLRARYATARHQRRSGRAFEAGRFKRMAEFYPGCNAAQRWIGEYRLRRVGEFWVSARSASSKYAPH